MASRAPQPAHPARLPDPSGAAASLSGPVLILFVFLIYSRVHELLPVRLRPVLLLAALTFGFLILSGGLLRALNTKPGKLLAAFTLWFVVTIPFSSYRRGSLEMLTNTFSFAILCFLATAGLIRSFTHLRRFLWAIVGGAGAIAGLALYGGEISFGRLAVASAFTGTLDNANELALYLNFGLPFCIFLLLDRQRSRLTRLLAAMLALVNIYVTLRTGSRMGFLALITIGLLFLARGSLKNTAVAAVGLLLIGALLLVVLPAGLTVRYRMLFEDSIADVAEEEGGFISPAASRAVASTLQRKRAILAGLETTLRHPLFGVGPGQFGTAMAKMPEWNLAWRQPHNTYMQLSSETGIPGFVLYVWAVAYCVRRSYRIYSLARDHRAHQQIARLAFCLFAALVTLVVVCNFGHLAYTFMPLLLCGLAVALELNCPPELAARLNPAPAPAGAMIRPRKQALARPDAAHPVPTHGA